MKISTRAAAILQTAILCLALTVCGTIARARDTALVDPMQVDAQLTDVCFIDAARGWAVGDRGVIWHTSDGGQNWKLQPSNVDCQLASVVFLDEKNGWAAGGFTQPYTRASRGVVLRTRDGGEHWTLDRKLVLPAIRQIRFFDPAHGWAFGQSSAYFPSGVFSTSDGGLSWSAMSAGQTGNWLAGELADPDNGALAGRAGAAAVVRRRSVEQHEGDFGLRALRRMKLVAPAVAWLVGDGGLVLKTQDLGKSWQTTEGDVPAVMRNYFDFSALAVRGPHCWVAGTPGTCVLHSTDAGRTWVIEQTSQSLPLRALAFVGEQTGWAVGDFGTILATRDGGHSWRPQRSGGTRSAYLGFYSRASDIPLELIARLSGDEGYLGAMEVLNREDVEPRTSATGDLALEAHEASVRAGGSVAETAWRFPLRSLGLKLSAEQLIEGWDLANDGGAIEKLESHVVARIRTWRPSVVFTAAAESRGYDPLSHVVNQLVLRAVERAAEASQYPEQIAEAGLRPWKVQKVYAALPSGLTGNVNVSTAQLATRLGRSIGELAAPARGLVDSQFSAPNANIGFRLLVDHIPQGLGERDFFSGIALSAGGEARRAFVEASENNLEAMRREAQLRRNLQAILAAADGRDPRDGRFLADIGQQTRTMEPARAADVLFQLAQRYYHQGRWELAAECFALIAERYANHPLAASSLVWLVQYYASQEAAWRNRGDQQLSVQQIAAQAPVSRPDAVDPASDRARAGQTLGVDRQQGGVRPASALSAAARVERGGGVVNDLPASEGPLAKAAAYARQLEQHEAALFGEPRVRFPLAAAHRRQGLPRQAERFYQALRHSRPHDAWWACAQTELWLADPKAQPTKELWNCARAEGKPRLDGRLDEPLWHGGNTVELRSPQRDDDDWRAVAMLAYDEEFLYIGVSCARAAGFKYVKSDQPRPRDPDLTDQDRVELLLDVDRDFATYYRLVIDHRGWTFESLWNDASWDPNWFVAAAGGDGAWTAEAAIPLSELTQQPPAPKQSWAVGVQRIVPGVGLQSWTTPASPEIVPEGFGILMFQ